MEDEVFRSKRPLFRSIEKSYDWMMSFLFFYIGSARFLPLETRNRV